MALGFFDDCDVLAAWCEMREGVRHLRHLRLDRIKALQRLPARRPVARGILLAQWRAIETGVET